ncbi:MAG: hypothetical protein OXG99_08655 [Alphaproteobacteria bacterium]|nr:hypothetical protein [Alphaproteobacteria bacterium]
MRTIKHWALAASAAAALALAGCGGGGGGGSSSTTPTTPTEPPPPSALSFATDLNGSVDALMALSGDADTEGSALMMAMKYSAMIGTLASDGNSMAAMMSAQKVLDARTMLMEAIEAAKADLMEAEEAKAGTEDADVIEALDQAIEAAETEIEAAEEILGGDDLAGYVEMVTGDDEDDVKTAADRGKEVAMAVAMALAPASSDNGLGARLNPDTSDPPVSRILAGAMPPDTVKDANKLETDDHMGMTWMEITGASMKMRIATTATDTNEVYVSSITDMVLASTQTATAADATEDDGLQVAATYKGIPGTAICTGDDCKVETVADVGTSGQPGFVDNTGNRKFAGSWYFTPTNPKTYYMKGMDGSYSIEEYAQFGHWLVVADNGDVTVNTYAQRVDLTDAGADADSTATGSWVGPSPTATDAGMKASSATYEGMAVGRSVHKTLDGDGDITDIQSGRFMANVTLNATFAAAASTLGGMIDGFTSPDNPGAVDEDWTVKLNSIATSDGTVTAGVTEATGQKGVWSAASYGTGTSTDDDAAGGRRPAGIYGGFNAHFTDGHVAGAYATRKQ